MFKSAVPELIIYDGGYSEIMGKLAPAQSLQGDLSVSWVATGSCAPLSSQRRRDWSTLPAKPRRCGGMHSLARKCFSLPFGTCAHVRESPKNGLLLAKLGSFLGTCGLVLSGKDQ